jgi:hypothetical protein
MPLYASRYAVLRGEAGFETFVVDFDLGGIIAEWWREKKEMGRVRSGDVLTVDVDTK